MDLPETEGKGCSKGLYRGESQVSVARPGIPFGVSLLYEEFQAFEVALLSPFWTGVDPTFVDQNVDRVEPGNFALEFIVMSLHELIQFMDRDTFRMLTHQAENQLDGTILLGEFSTVRHDCSFLPPFFLAILAMGDTWPEALSGKS